MLVILTLGSAAPAGTLSTEATPTLTLKKVSGTVFLREADSSTFASFSGTRRISAGTEVEASNGRVELRASSGQHGEFYKGRFVILLPPSQPNVIELDLSGSSFKTCRTGRAFESAEEKAPPKRRLWGKAKGKFVTRGRYSVTSVRGTTWLTADGCDGTSAKVTVGSVGVADLLRNRQVVVRRGKSYFSKAPVEYGIPSDSSSPTSIALGSDGNLWFTESAGSIGRSTPSGNIVEFPVPGSNSGDESSGGSPDLIIAGPDSNLWFTDPDSQSVNRITTDGKLTSFRVSGAPQGLTVGPDRNIWFTEDNATLGRLTPTGTLTERSLPLEFASDAGSITTGADGNLWFVEVAANKIGRVTTSGNLAEFEIPTPDSSPTGITHGADGNVWFTELTAGKVARITPTGTITEFSLTEDSGPAQITLGPDKNFWVTESVASRIARITPAGRITEIPTPTDQAAPAGITTGPRNTIWFTETDANNIACALC